MHLSATAYISVVQVTGLKLEGLFILAREKGSTLFKHVSTHSSSNLYYRSFSYYGATIQRPGSRAIASNFSRGLQSASMLWEIVSYTIRMELPVSVLKFRRDCPEPGSTFP